MENRLIEFYGQFWYDDFDKRYRFMCNFGMMTLITCIYTSYCL